MVALVRGERERERAKETSSAENANPNPSIFFPFTFCSSLCVVSVATVVIAVRWSSQFGFKGSCKLLLSTAPAIHHDARPSRPAGALHNWAVGGSKPLQSGHSPGLGELCWRAGNSTWLAYIILCFGLIHENRQSFPTYRFRLQFVRSIARSL